MHDRHERLMRLALEEANRAGEEGNEPFGAVVTRGDDVVARGRNLVRSTHDVTAHCEVVALRTASSELRQIDLAGFTLYTTFEPCPMCCGAVLASGVTGLVIAASEDPDKRWGNYSVARLLELTGSAPGLQVTSDILAAESLELVARWAPSPGAASR